MCKTFVAAFAVAFACSSLPAQEPDMRDLLTKRLKAAQQVYQGHKHLWDEGTLPLPTTTVYEWSKKLRDAELDLAETAAQRIAAWNRYHADAKKMEQRAEEGFKLGTLTPEMYHEAQYFRLDAEIGLARAKAKGARP